MFDTFTQKFPRDYTAAYSLVTSSKMVCPKIVEFAAVAKPNQVSIWYGIYDLVVLKPNIKYHRCCSLFE